MPRIDDCRTERRSLATRVARLASDPRRQLEMARALARYSFAVATYPFTVGFAYLSYFRSLARRRTDFVLEQWDGLRDLPSATKVAIFSHFDPRGTLHDFVAHYLQQLEEAGFTVIFVSNAPLLTEETISRLRPRCGLILRRANVGYDFAAYKDGIARVPDLGRLETLLLVNDSAYGPFHPLKDIVARMDSSADVWGITDSWERHYHLQSYFLLFGRKALQSASFARFWGKFRYVNSKHWIISAGEIGLSRKLGAEGIRCQALFPYRPAAAALLRAWRDEENPHFDTLDFDQREFFRRLAYAIGRNRPVNSTHFFWDYLIVRQGCPFLKRELLRDNPVRVPYIREWTHVIKSASAYDTGLIARHLELTMPHRPLPDPAAPGRPYRAWFA